MRFLTASITSNNSANFWAQIYEKNNFVSLVKAQSSQEVPFSASDVFKSLDLLIEKSSLYNKNSLAQIAQEIFKRYSAAQESFSFGALFLDENNELSVLASQGIGVYLYRNGSIAKILQPSTKEIQKVKGSTKEGDIYLIATNTFLEKLNKEELKQNLKTHDIQNIEEYFAPLAFQSEKFPLSACFILINHDLTVNKNIGFRQKTLSFLDRVIAVAQKKKEIVIETQGFFEGRRKRRVLPLIGLLLLVLLVISIFFGQRHKNYLSIKNDLKISVSQIETKLAEARSIGGTSRDKARSILFSARDDLQILKTDYPNEAQIMQLEKSVEESLMEVSGVYKSQLDLFLNLSLTTSGFLGNNLNLSGDNIVVWDKSINKLISVNANTKSTKFLAGEDKVSGAKAICSYFDRNFVLNDKGIVGINESLTLEKDWGDQSLCNTFAGNLYILDQTNSEIFRYSMGNSFFGEKTPWFRDSNIPDLSSIVDWNIDGSIWVFTEGGKLYRWNSGVSAPINLSDELPRFSPSGFYTDEETPDLYFLDRESSRIVVFDKQGGFVAEYESSDLSKTTDFVVYAKEKKVFLLIDGKIHFFEIKH